MSPRAKLMEALRTQVHYQILAAKKRMLARAGGKCPFCRRPKFHAAMEVDHVKPFHEIFEDFMKGWPQIDPSAVEYAWNQAFRRWQLSSDHIAFSQAFDKHHFHVMRLQILCIECHDAKDNMKRAVAR